MRSMIDPSFYLGVALSVKIQAPEWSVQRWRLPPFGMTIYAPRMKLHAERCDLSDVVI